MQIFVKTLTGKTITVDIELHDLVEGVKERVAEKEGVPVAEVRLIFGGKQLQDGLPISFYDLKPDSTVHLVLTLRGGGRAGGWFLVALIILKILLLLLLWFFCWIPAVGQRAHSGFADPTVIKWFFTALVIICIIFFIGVLIWRSQVRPIRYRINFGAWAFGISLFFLIILTIYAWLLDGRIMDTFTDGIPVLPDAYNNTDQMAEVKLYIEWIAFLILAVTHISIIVVSSAATVMVLWNSRVPKEPKTERRSGKQRKGRSNDYIELPLNA